MSVCVVDTMPLDVLKMLLFPLKLSIIKQISLMLACYHANQIKEKRESLKLDMSSIV